MIREVASLQHPLIKHFVRLRQDKDYRNEHKSVVITGKKMIEEVCSRHHTKTLMIVDASLVPPGIAVDDIVLVSEAIIQKVTGMASSEGMAAEVSMPHPATLSGMRYIFAFDGISDPGNLGTLLRSGLALGWQGAFILNSSCDPYNDKALRVAKGATFRLPIAMGSWEDLAKVVQTNQLHPIAADITGSPLGSVKPLEKILLVLGNEAHGLSLEAQRLCQKVTIPMPGEMESLNVAVAGSILMYVLKNSL
jgi:TrmH family RNA methyltransferase